MEKKTEKRERTFTYTLARIVAFVTLHLFFPVRYHGKSLFDTMNAPYILMCNHKSWMDPLVLAAPIKRYEVRFLGKKELAKGRFLQFITGKLHMISVGRHESDIHAMRACSKALREGNILGIFPEGTRHLPSLMSEVETGVAVLALREKVPLLPVYIHGKLKLFHITQVYVGSPMDVSDLSREGTDMQTAEKLAERIRQTYFSLRDQACADCRRKEEK